MIDEVDGSNVMEIKSNWYVDTEGTVGNLRNRQGRWTLMVRASAFCHGVTPPILENKEILSNSRHCALQLIV